MSASPRHKKAARRLPMQPTKPDGTPRRRLPSDERRAAILGEAAALFADEGFGASTRALAARLGITQAAIYKHFRSKDEIVAALFEERADRWRGQDWRTALASDDAPLADRLGRLYAGYLGNITARSMRLFIRAGLDGYRQPGRRGAMLTSSIFAPVIAALRREARLPDLSDRRMLHEEREIAMALHGAIMFLAIRKHVYRMALPHELSEHAMRQIRMWVPGAIKEIRRLHAVAPEQAVPQLSPRR